MLKTAGSLAGKRHTAVMKETNRQKVLAELTNAGIPWTIGSTKPF